MTSAEKCRHPGFTHSMIVGLLTSIQIEGDNPSIMTQDLVFCFLWSIYCKTSQCKTATGDNVNFNHCLKGEGNY